MKPILAVMIGWRLMIDVPALTRRSFYRPLLRSLRLHATDGTLEHGFQQLPFCVTGTTTGPVAVAGTWPVGLHLRGDLLRLGEQGFHDLVFRHGLDDLALDENLPLAVARATPKSASRASPGPLTMQPMTATRIGAVTSFNLLVTALAS